MNFGISYFNTFEKAVEREYLITNGIGGFCSSTIIGANIRKYHGLLNAALVPPVNRTMILSKLDEVLYLEGKEHKICSNDFIDSRDEGYLNMTRFSNYPLPKMQYNIDDVIITKEIAMEHGKNTVAILYTISTGAKPGQITFAPYTNYRDHHGNSKIGDFYYNQSFSEGLLLLTEQNSGLNLKIISNCQYHRQEQWSKALIYLNEKERELNAVDYSFIPGQFKLNLKSYSNYTVSFVASVEQSPALDAQTVINKEKQRRQLLINRAGYKEQFLKDLVIGCDQFIVHRQSTDTKTVIAGYPWFTDWGRDTMIAYTGVTLATGRYEDAKEILLTFVRYIKDGLIPNMFPDGNQQPLYNTVDGTLWFFYAVNKYLEYTKDYKTVVEEIYPHLKNIIEHHIKGTVFDIFMDEDCLLSAGGPGTQLTWMDVKVDDWVVTPRHGKAVEINALWYNALKVMENLAQRFGDDERLYADISNKTYESFNKLFWNDKEQCLYDCIQEGMPIDKIRPNQIIAVSLPYSILDIDRASLVVQKVHEKLYTPYGLRTLSKDDEEYQGIYIGTILQRDGAYHQGTVWPWPMGPFTEAYAKVNNYSKESIESVKIMLEQFYLHMEDGCIGSIAEILDGDRPHYPRGCPAQAWSVSEVLRSYVEIVLRRGSDDNQTV
jgi:predicted glycogen debranching enzyme